MRLVVIGFLLLLIGGIFAAAWDGYGLYVMVILDLIGIAAILIGLTRHLRLRMSRRHAH